MGSQTPMCCGERLIPPRGGVAPGAGNGHGRHHPGVINDVGFVSSDSGTLRVAVFCKNLPDLDFAERSIGLIAREALALTGIIPFAGN